MYLKKMLVLNSGAIADFEYEFQFDDKGQPKPTLIVGANGSGKTNLMSIIADGLVELAATKFNDVREPKQGGGHKYFRTLGGASTRVGSTFEFSALHFYHDNDDTTCFSKSGTIKKEDVQDRIAGFPNNPTWVETGITKNCLPAAAKIDNIFRSECMAFFPSSRSEVPYWSSQTSPSARSEFSARYQDELQKEICPSSSLTALKPWLIDVLLDVSIEPASVKLGPMGELQLPPHALLNTSAIANFNSLLKLIFKKDTLRLVRTGRAHKNRKLQIYDGEDMFLPSLDALSTGQASLLGIFSTILRYADTGAVAVPTSQLKGIVVIDEADAHLHADLQYDVLPNLIKLFPQIQFIVTAHAPLFPLGMQQIFGDSGFEILEAPSGIKISAERFSEFETSMAYFKETKSFEAALSERSKAQTRPLVLCEGQTDPIYLKTAAQVLGFDRLQKDVDWDCVGAESNKGAKGGGDSHIRKAAVLFENNPRLVVAPTLLLFDCEVKDAPINKGLLQLRSLPLNPQNTITDRGIENLLPDAVFEDRFYEERNYQNGPNRTTSRVLDKQALCQSLSNSPIPQIFEGFRESLIMIEAALFDSDA